MVQEAIAQIHMGKVTHMRRLVDNSKGKRLLIMKKDVQLSEQEVLCFNTDKLTWNSFPKPEESTFSAVACAVMDNKLHVVGSNLEMSILDLNNNNWTTRDGVYYYVDRRNFALAVHQGNLYLVGGTKKKGYGTSSTNEVTRYSLITLKWQMQSNMKEARHSPTVNSVGGAMYAFGGGKAPEKFFNNVWSSIQDCDNSGFIKVSAVKDGLIYTIGERDIDTDVFLNIYNPAEDFWMYPKKFTLPEGISGLCIANGDFYIVGSDREQKISIQRIDFKKMSSIIVSQRFEDWSNVSLAAY
ncbi:uncharacterized protein LOC144425866 isoform X1 [Styela clava]